MKKFALPGSILGILLLLLCAVYYKNKQKKAEEPEQVSVPTEITQADAPSGVTSVVSHALQELLKDDIEKGLIPEEERNYIYSEVDLNGDGKNEIFAGPRGSYFCGSGGCTFYLLTPEGKEITVFTVVDIPVYVLESTTNGWKDIVMYSGGGYHVVKFDGKTYPSNPSVEPAYKGDLPETAMKLFGEDNLEFHKY